MIRWVTAGPAGVVDLCIDGLEMRTGENPVHAPSAAPAGEEMHRAFVARGDRMRGAKNVVQRRRPGVNLAAKASTNSSSPSGPSRNFSIASFNWTTRQMILRNDEHARRSASLSLASCKFATT